MRLIFVGNPRSPHFYRPLRRLLDLGHKVLVFGYSPPLGEWPASMRFMQHPMHDHPKAIAMLRECAKSFRPDVIHVHWADPLAWQCVEADVAPTVLSVWGSDVNRIVSMHEDGTTSYAGTAEYPATYGFRILAGSMHRMAHIIVDDPAMVRKCRLLAGEQTPIHRIPLGVDDSFLSPVPVESVHRLRSELGLGPDDSMLLSVRTFRRHYGHLEILEAFAKARIPDNMHLVFKLFDPNTLVLQSFQGSSGLTTGDSFVRQGEAEELQSLELELRQRIETLGLGNRVHCIGSLIDELMPALVASASAIINFPTMDGFPVTFAEAGAIGTQVISCMHPSYADSFAEHFFHMAPERTVTALAQAIETFAATTPDAASDRLHQAREAVLGEYTLDNYVNKVLQLYEDARGRAAERTPAPAATGSCPPRVSVLIPCHNYARFLGECLQSLIAQTFQDWEAIVVDDGSTQGDVAQVTQSVRDSRIRCIQFPENRGKGRAFNTAFAASRADLVMLLDADDALTPDYLESCLAALDRYPGLDVVHTDIKLCGKRQAVWEYPTRSEQEMTLVQWIPGPGPVMRRQVYAATGGHYEGPELRYGNIDWEFWIAAIRRELSVLRIPRPLYLYRQHGNNISMRRPYNEHVTRECIHRRHEALFSLWGTGPKFRSEGHALAARTSWQRDERLRAALLAARAYLLTPSPLPRLAQPEIPTHMLERMRTRLEKALGGDGTVSLEIRPEIIDARMTLAALLLREGNRQGAIHQYHVLLGQLLGTDDVQNIAGIILLLALTLFESGDNDEAAEALECLHVVHPTLPECERLRVHLALERGDPVMALRLAQQFVAMSEASDPALLVLGEAVARVLHRHKDRLPRMLRQFESPTRDVRPDKLSLQERIYATSLGRRLYWSHRAKDLYETYGHLQGGFAPLAAALQQVRPRRVLEIGCGNGRLLEPVAAFGVEELVGQDISATALELAHKRQIPGVVLHEIPMDDLPYAEGHFDLVICNRVLQHIRPEELPAALATIARLGRHLYINETLANDASDSYYLFHHDYAALLAARGKYAVETLGEGDQRALLFIPDGTTGSTGTTGTDDAPANTARPRRHSFRHALQERMRQSAYERHLDNNRYYHHCDSQQHRLLDLEYFRGKRHPPYFDVSHFAHPMDEQAGYMAFLYERLADDASRRKLVDVAAFRILGHKHVRLSYHTPDLRHKRNVMTRLADRAAQADPALLDALRQDTSHHCLSFYDLSPVGLDLRCYALREEAYRMCHAPSYRCPTEQGPLGYRPDDVILDCGAAFGDISLFMAHEIGEKGTVYAFEPHPFYKQVLAANLAANPALCDRIVHVPLAVWHTPGLELSFSLDSTSSRVNSAGSSTVTVQTTSIDAFVERHALDRVDFLKLDVEGAELEVLQGAVQTLRKFRPRCAICLYHKSEDFDVLPRFVAELGLGYRFYLNQHSVCEHETVLYTTI